MIRDNLLNKNTKINPIIIFNSRIEGKTKDLNDHLINLAINILEGEINSSNCDEALLKGISLSRELKQDLQVWENLVEKY